AFYETPNRALPWALATFISFKCFTNSCGQSTAEGIHAGFQKYWDRADVEGLYQGPWRWDEEANCAFGNPSTAYDVQETISAVWKKGGEDGIWTHSGAMSLQYLECIYAWSRQQCSMLTSLPPATTMLLTERYNVHKHLGWQALSSIGWTVWTRYIYSDIGQSEMETSHFNCVTEDCFRIPHWQISLEQRKNWQNKMINLCEISGHIYEIYPQPELPAADLDYHMKVWISYLETHVYGRALQDEDYFFPSINVNGVAHPERPMSHDIVQ
ncbi:hypothetical protein BU17DRAFT_17785, partial [Hysterangium stoloniferum]